MEVTCKSCGKPIQVKPSHILPDGNYCSRDCYWARPLMACKVCGKPIKVRLCRALPDGNYCSKACQYSAKGSQAIYAHRRTGEHKMCEVCGKEFYVPTCRSAQKFCSRTCKGIASRLPKKNCVVCGKEWQPYFGKSDQLCCSEECKYLYRRTGETVPCTICGKDVYLPKNRLEKGTQYFFCSKEHANEWTRRNQKKYSCKICGKEFHRSASRHKWATITYCSRTCCNADPETYAKLIDINAKQQQMKPNHVERTGYKLLEELGVEFLPQHTIGRFCVDAFLPSLGVVVQFDGDYWHGNPAFYPTLSPRQRKRVNLDRAHDAYMEVCGYPVIRIWASNLEKHLDIVKTRLHQFLSTLGYEQVAKAAYGKEIE